MKIEFIEPKRAGIFGGWSRRCRVDGVEYHVSLKRGKSVRIPYKPRGKNIGWQYHGAVYSNGRCLWSERVNGSAGVRGMLIGAGVIEAKPEKVIR